jgi:hypothetical protein
MRGLEMSRILRFALLATLFALAVPATAVARPLGLPETLTTAHFQIHYTGNPASEDSIVHQQAGDLAGHAERAYTTFVNQWGYTAPLDDGDGKIDIYVVDTKPALGFAIADTPAASQTSGYILLDATSVGMSETIAHEVFHLVQAAVWAPMDAWLMEGTAEWAGFRFLNFPAVIGDVSLGETLGAPDMSLSCSGDACGLSDYERGGYSRWHFYQYLTERWGGNVVIDIFKKGKALNDVTLTGTDILTAALADKGTTLNNAFTDWTVANMTGAYQAEGLKGLQPVAYSTTTTGSASGALPVQKIDVNHLASRYVGFERGDGSTGPCYAATLTLNVTLPSGVASRPYFFWNAPGSSAMPLAVSGSTASLSVPWDTCAWAYRGLLALPNPSPSVDAAQFTVSGSITVDKTRIATAKPPTPGPYTGPTIPAPLVDEAPSIALYGPEILRVATKTRVLRLVVFSSGPGQLNAAVGGSELGTRTLRTGNNDLRFTVPRSMLRTLATRASLKLTSLSPNGHVGATLTRPIRLSK